MIPDEQGIFHGTRRNFKGLHHKGPNEKGQDNGNKYGFYVFPQGTFGFFFRPDSRGTILIFQWVTALFDLKIMLGFSQKKRTVFNGFLEQHGNFPGLDHAGQRYSGDFLTLDHDGPTFQFRITDLAITL